MTISRNLSFLAEGVSSTGVLGATYGGTGLTSLTASYIPYGNGTSAFNSSANLTFSGTQLATTRLLASGDYATNAGDLTLTNTNGGRSWRIGDGIGGFPTSLIFWDSTGAAVRMAIGATGGVSIGNTTDPGATNLSVTGSLTLGTKLTVANGGTGLATLTAGYIPYGNGTGAFNSGSSLQYTSNGNGFSLAVANGGTWSEFSYQSSINLGNSGYGTYTARAGQVIFGSNFYVNSGAGYSYKNTDYASLISFTNGQIQFDVAASGTAGTGLSGFLQAVTIFPSGGMSVGNTTDKGAASLNVSGLIYPQQATTAGAPAYVKGAIYFDTTLNKLRVGGATAWETITSV